LILPGSFFVTAKTAGAQSAPTLDSEEWAFLTSINNFRAQNGVGPLQVSVDLEKSSQWMSTDMAAKNYFSHTDSLGRDPVTRMQAFGYLHNPEGENLAAGYSDALNTFNLFANACDPDATGKCTYAHRQNMLYSGYVAIGIARAYNAASTYGWYWTTDFGGAIDQVITQGASPALTTSVTPASGSGLTNTFTYTYGDSTGYTDIATAAALIGGSNNGVNACWTVYVPSTNSLYLYDNTGAKQQGPIAPGTGSTISNSQCTLNGSGSSASGSGNNLTLKLNLTFTQSFAGTQTNFGYTASKEGANTGWMNVGTWTVPGSTVPLQAVSVTPNSGSGTSATFTYLYTDPKGFADISYAEAVFTGNGNLVNACWFAYFPAWNSFYLVNDSGNSLAGPLTPGSGGSLSNSQCTLNGTGSSAAGSGNSLTLKVNLTFKAAFDGAKANDGSLVNNAGQLTNWSQLGNWTVR
jgi:uncharacterized protein YkwD